MLMNNVADLLEKNKEKYGRMVTLEIGRPSYYYCSRYVLTSFKLNKEYQNPKSALNFVDGTPRMRPKS